MSSPKVPFGAAMRQTCFAFSPSYTPLNHGSYGAHPIPVRTTHLALRAEAEAAPDPFIALEWAPRLAKSRTLTAQMLSCPVDELVFVQNATTGIDTVLKNLKWEEGDVALCYELVYGAVAHGLAYLAETRGVEVKMLKFEWPISDDELVNMMVAAAREINGQPRKRCRLAICDTIISGPGARVPWERIVPALQAEGALVLVDGAHGIGHIDLDLSKTRPDFFVTNLHKWLFVPRGCAALVVKKEHQEMIRTSLPTSHGFIPRKDIYDMQVPMSRDLGNGFVEMFDFIGTADMTNYLCVETAIKFRNEVCGGEETIRRYTHSIAQRGAEIIAGILGTEIMDHPGSCMRQCNFANIRLPLEISQKGHQVEEGAISPEDAELVCPWIKRIGYEESGIYFQVFPYRGRFWWRISGMIYLDEDDFRKGGEVLRDLCERVTKGKYHETAHKHDGQLELAQGAVLNQNAESSTDESAVPTPVGDSE